MLSKIVAALTLTALIALAACTKQANNTTAKGALRDYVTKVFAISKPDDLDELEALTVDKAHDELVALKGNREEFNKAFVEQKMTSASALKIRDERKVSNDQYAITYELEYKNHSDATDDRVTTKKLAVIVLRDGRWYISDVQNIKTFVEHAVEESIAGTAKR